MQSRPKIWQRLDPLIETVMLEPGGRDAAGVLIFFRYVMIIFNTGFLLVFTLAWTVSWQTVLLLAGINVLLLLITLVLSFARAIASPRLLYRLMVGAFLVDLSVELLALMSSGLTHSTLVAAPLISLMTLAVLLDLRATLLGAAYFLVAYPVGALLVSRGTWSFLLPWSSSAPALGLSFVVIQEVYFVTVLAAFCLLISKLRRSYRRVSDDLEEASMAIHQRQLEKLQAETLLLQRERDYRLLADQVTDMIALCDPRLEYTYVSPSSATILGRPPEELTGRWLRELIHHDDWAAVQSMLEKPPAELPAGEFVVEHRASHSDGHWVWLETRGRSLADGRYVLSSRDITERRLLEEKMRQAQKLESLGLLAGGVAHDFNNILLGIMGNAELTAMEQPADSSSRQSLLTIVSAAQRAAGLCRQLLAYSGRGSLAVAPLNLNDLVEELPALLRAALPRNATLVLDLDRELPCVEGDAAQIQQVAMNLIINAAEALPAEGGSVRIRSGVSRQGQPPSAGTGHHLEWAMSGPAPDHVYLTVSDDGCGMDAETLERMFDPFFSTKFTGRGLGLSAVAGIVNSHRGMIRVRSQPGQGTEVWVAFPLGEGSGVRPLPAPATAETAPGWRGSGKVLVIDDEPPILEVVSRMLVRLGFQVLTAPGGAEGMAVFQREAAEIAFVICDFAMPQMDGMATLRAMRELRPDLPVVITSGLAEKQLQNRFSGSEVRDFLQKPFSFRDLARTAQRLCQPPG